MGQDPQAEERRLAGPVDDALASWRDPLGVHWNFGPSLTVFGATPDGRRLLARTIQYDADPAHLVALLSAGTDRFVAAGAVTVTPEATLAVQLRLPDRQGIVVGAFGTALRYRTGTGDWHDIGQNGGLIPDDAVEVQATRDGTTRTAMLTR